MDESIQKQLEQRILNPWIAKHPDEARALADLGAHLRTEQVLQRWTFENVRLESACGTVACAAGHSPNVPSCAALGISIDNCGDAPWELFRLPPSPRRDRFYGSNVAHEFFSCGHYEIEDAKVTPHIVADRIEHWLATGEIL